MEAIRAAAVSKIYARPEGDVAALDGVHLSVQAGEFVTINGPSGSGKTTLMLTLGGLVRPTGGSVEIGGVPVYDLPVKERAAFRLGRIGFLFQTFNLVPYLTAQQNVSVPMHLAGYPKTRQRERALGLLETFGLAPRAAHKPAELSVGQQQRVSLCRALANDPELILADEPTGNLDPAMTAEVIRAFHDLCARGKTIVMVTHSDRLAGEGTRRITIDGGRVVGP